MRSDNEDLWKKPTNGGRAIQITTNLARDTYGDWSPNGKEILFLSDRGGFNNVWVISAEGGNARRITANSDSVFNIQSTYACWSPDGKEIAFTAAPDGKSGDIWIIPTEGGSARRLTHTPSLDASPHYSPDGKSITYQSGFDASDIWIIPAVGGTPRQLTNDPAWEIQSRFSPNGQWVAFTSSRSGSFDIWIIPSAGGTARQVTDTPWLVDYKPTWSPDGQRITFNAQPTLGELWRMRADGSEPQSIAQNIFVRGSYFPGPVGVSPTGREVAFVAPSPEGVDLWKMQTSGGPWSRITQGGSATIRSNCTSYSPDGQQVAFLSEVGGSINIWTVEASGGSPNQVTISDEGDLVGCMRWSPDGNYLLYEMSRGGDQIGSVDIWMVPASGGKAELILDWPQYLWEPSWSPNGQYFAFVKFDPLVYSNLSKQYSLWVHNFTNDESSFLTEGEQPAWSPDGKTILFVRGIEAAKGDIWKMPATGGTIIPILKSTFTDSYPTWSADGQDVFFYRASEGDIWITDVSEIIGSQ